MSGRVDSQAHVADDGNEPVWLECCGACCRRDHTASCACKVGATSLRLAATLEPSEIPFLVAALRLVQRTRRGAQLRRKQRLRDTAQMRGLLMKTVKDQIRLAARSARLDMMAVDCRDPDTLQKFVTQQRRARAWHHKHTQLYT